ncbi:Planctomycete cytochrome C [Neorhodopirellula lusitana]|uniref:Planctomycete cytochrome C n=1 Tax=Neorhodopirellula lusitana TaxID=445327 RepID=A0ABY1QGY5_9BACT|nr:DUF1553 domain-containing protein [Neorhodopirellula lusitana]SMP71290.1 Planctomycete cytochrome C [Neorhodopirellula lusitana]
MKNVVPLVLFLGIVWAVVAIPSAAENGAAYTVAASADKPSASVDVHDAAEGTSANGDSENAKHAASEENAKEVSFSETVRPILTDKCFHCHGPDSDNQDSDFRLDTAANALADLGGYAGIVPGDPSESELIVRIHADADDDSVMPPADAVRQLTEDEKRILGQWIQQGADFEGHWAFESVPSEISVPATESEWAQSPIDQFILKTATEAEVAPNPPASREVWLRRVTFDLTGLPPTLEELDAFLADTSGDAYAKVVDRLLASDACAERLTSEWLDVARYSDSFGYQRDDERYVWPYRDWVVQAFKSNMPYDQFVTEQLAGDLLDAPTRDQILATTFNRLHSHKKEGGVAIEEFRVENVSDRAHTFSAAFMGLTMECARCHDHKYDPIKTKEYYEVSSFFANVDERGLISYFTSATPTPAMPLPTAAQQAELDRFATAITNAGKQYIAYTRESLTEFASWLAGQVSGNDDNTSVSAQQEDSARHDLPGMVASLSFEEMQVPGEDVELQDETGKKPRKSEAEKFRVMRNDVAGNKIAFTLNDNQIVDGVKGNGLRLTGDDAVVLPGIGRFHRHDPFSYSIWIRPEELTERGVILRRSRGWDDAGSVGYELTKLGGKLTARLVHFWPGNAIAIETDNVLKQNEWQHVSLTYDGSSKASGLQLFIDGKPAHTHIVQDSLTRSIAKWNGGYNDFAIGSRYRDRGFKDGSVDEFRGFDRQLSQIEVQQLAGGPTVVEILTKPADQLTASETELLHEYWLLAVDAHAATLRDAIGKARAGWNKTMDSTDAITIMREQETPRKAYILTRGVYDSHGEEVTADTPDFLPPFPDDQPRNRLGLARWLLTDEHPLTSRVVVNRYWQLMFGQGLVRTPEDFGLQGETPTHPDLLDWLARDMMDHDWNVRRLLRQIALSSTYRQASVVTPQVRDRDPDNRLWARGPSQRLSAEMVRDSALAVSGLLVSKVGGPPVKPYDIALAYTPMSVDKEEALYRRSLYTFWKRTSPAPVMIALNANKREVCRLRREIVASPLQALVLLNGTQFIETARATALRLIHEHGQDAEVIAVNGFRLLTSRHPTSEELAVLKQLHQDQLTHFAENLDDAKKLLSVGDLPISDAVPADFLAATTVLINTMMNLDQSVRNQ